MIIVFDCSFFALFDNLSIKCLIREYILDSLCQGLGIVIRYDKPCTLDNLAQAWHVRDNDRQARCHNLDRGQPEALPMRTMDAEVCLHQQVGDVRPCAHEGDAVSHTKVCCQLATGWQCRPVTDKGNMILKRQEGHRAYNLSMILGLDKARYHNQTAILQLAALGTELKTREVYPILDNDVTVGAGVAQPTEEAGAGLGADADNPVVARVYEPLDGTQIELGAPPVRRTMFGIEQPGTCTPPCQSHQIQCREEVHMHDVVGGDEAANLAYQPWRLETAGMEGVYRYATLADIVCHIALEVSDDEEIDRVSLGLHQRQHIGYEALCPTGLEVVDDMQDLHCQ